MQETTQQEDNITTVFNKRLKLYFVILLDISMREFLVFNMHFYILNLTNLIF